MSRGLLSQPERRMWEPPAVTDGPLDAPKVSSMVDLEIMPCAIFAWNCRDPRHAKGQNLVYRAYDEWGELLYIGTTQNFHARMRDHIESQDWWDEVRHVAWTTYPTRQEARADELVAINSENPRYNLRRRVPFVDEYEEAIDRARYDDLRESVE